MDTPDAVAMAQTQVEMVLEGGGLMTLNRLVEVAGEWAESPSSHAAVMSGLWSGVVDE